MSQGFLKPQRILIVDDHEDIRDLIGLALRDYQVFHANDGIEGLAAARRLKPDLVVLDMMMPNLDGLGFLRHIREDPELRLLKVLVLSARSTTEDLVAGLELGAIDYVTKPFKNEVLQAKVERLLQLRFAQEIAEFQETLWRYLDHHLRAPLSLINTSATLLRDLPEGKGETAACALGLVAEGIEAIEAVITQGSFLAHLLREEPRIGTVNLRAMLATLRGDLIARAARQGGREIDWRLPDGDEPLAVAGDPELIRMALEAVLRNAVDHTSPGDAVRVTIEATVDQVVLRIADNGPGIDADRLRRLFVPFEADLLLGAGLSGRLGLSLPIARLAVRLCGGQLECESSDGRGSVFVFTLPTIGGEPATTASWQAKERPVRLH